MNNQGLTMAKGLKILIIALLSLFVMSNAYAINKVSVFGAEQILFSPVPASCTPNTSGYCCGFGITNVIFNTINNNSTDEIGRASCRERV